MLSLGDLFKIRGSLQYTEVWPISPLENCMTFSVYFKPYVFTYTSGVAQETIEFLWAYSKQVYFLIFGKCFIIL